MRTTVTLDADVAALIRRMMDERGVSFKRALNDAIRAAAPASQPQRANATRTRRMGAPAISLDRALALAADSEDEERVRQMQVGK